MLLKLWSQGRSSLLLVAFTRCENTRNAVSSIIPFDITLRLINSTLHVTNMKYYYEVWDTEQKPCCLLQPGVSTHCWGPLPPNTKHKTPPRWSTNAYISKKQLVQLGSWLALKSSYLSFLKEGARLMCVSTKMHQDDDCAHWLSACGFVCVCVVCVRECVKPAHWRIVLLKPFAGMSVFGFLFWKHTFWSVEPVNLLTCLIIIYPKQGV